ncbi:WxL domain-containing protein [Candidatus Enterococcus ferrettii]|uniref:WxL domain-containing protein n=1 Tax=Candidatus Enterococcus ferrettii TaxID=2815324 RepID=A0ABV0EMT7_9ENTE|nr:WxL domain-containing protein [Enterococcus sp. 665A]MBO1339677.1 WxL domain-containing protein [Enterococcus sp. 665A]
MKLNKKILLFSVLFGWCLFSQESAAAQIDEYGGQTSLVIVPLDEEAPRLYEVSDLQFGDQSVTDTKTEHHAVSDLSIKLLDSRQQPTSWRLQVKLDAFKNEAQQTLKAAKLAIGKGTFIDSNVDNEVIGYPVSQLTTAYQPIIQATGKKDYGWITYTIPKEQITLSYGNENQAGEYTATISWQVVNADL